MSPLRQFIRRPVCAGFSWATVVALLAVIFGIVLLWWQIHQRTHSHAPVAWVNGVSIPRNQMADALRARVWQAGGEWSRLDEISRNVLRKQVLDHVIDQELLRQRANDQLLDQKNLATKTNQEKAQFLKQFDHEEEIRQRLELQGLSPEDLRQRIERETRLQMVMDQEVVQYYTKPTLEDARRWFDDHASTMIVPAEARAKQIFLTRHDEEKPDRDLEIREYHRQLVAGETTLSEVAARVSEDDYGRKRGGDLNWFSAERVPANFAKEVFALQPGQLSQPFLTDLGWHVVLLVEKRPARQAKFEEVREEILALLDTKARNESVRSLLQQWRREAKLEIREGALAQIQPSE